MSETNTPSSAPADLIPISSPVVAYLPELLDVHRLAVHIHHSLSGAGGDLPAILSGWVESEARGYLHEAFKALAAVSKIVAKGAAEAPFQAPDAKAALSNFSDLHDIHYELYAILDVVEDRLSEAPLKESSTAELVSAARRLSRLARDLGYSLEAEACRHAA